ncbi:MAG TPA: glycosyltransferase family 4 protein [Dehalococcoidia bacterium]|nr:glycosyltransferase family 4 protein [Dehalococcoidia bacterium]
MRQLRIAMIGQKGLPATFGGIEHHVEEIGHRLAQRGHRVLVYNRRNYARADKLRYRGMTVRSVPTIHRKHLDAIVHSSLATLHATAFGADVIHYHALGPGVPAILPRYTGRARVVLTVHGLDAERSKWDGAARACLHGAEWLSARVPDATIVVSKELMRHYAHRHHRATWYIPNGVDEPLPSSLSDIEALGLRPGGYILFVGRLVPEKAPDLLIRAFRRVQGDARLVIAGGSCFTDEYVRHLRHLAAADPRVMFPGYVFGAQLSALYANAAAFVLPSMLEGLPLTLLEAASHGTPIVASDISPHVEVLGAEGPGRRLSPAGDEEALALTLAQVLGEQDTERRAARCLREQVLRAYSWDDVVEATESVYRAVLADVREPPPGWQYRRDHIARSDPSGFGDILVGAPTEGAVRLTTSPMLVRETLVQPARLSSADHETAPVHPTPDPELLPNSESIPAGSRVPRVTPSTPGQT